MVLAALQSQLPLRGPLPADRLALLRVVGQDLALRQAALALGNPPATIDIPRHYKLWALQYGQRAEQVLTGTAAVVELFQQDGVDGRLLLVGEPGVGKTHTLLALGAALHLQARDARTAPVPVVVDLGGWNGQSLRQWVIDHLWRYYRVSASVGAAWVDGAALTLLLDGFDDLPPAQQRGCAAAIEGLLRGNVSQTAVLVCRRKTLDQLGLTFNSFNSGVHLLPMVAQQVKAFTQALQRPDLWQAIKADKTRQQLARFPLYLLLLAQIPPATAITNRQALIATWGQQTQRALSDPQRRLLPWLAQQLAQRQALFFSDDLTPDWLPPSQGWRYRLGLGLAMGAVAAVISGHLMLGLAVALVASQVDVHRLDHLRLSLACQNRGAILRLGLGCGLLGAGLGVVLGTLAVLLLGRVGLGAGAFAWGGAAGATLGWGAGLVGGTWGGLQQAIQIRTAPGQDLRLALGHGMGLGLLLLGLIGGMVVVPAVATGQSPLALLDWGAARTLGAGLGCGLLWLSGLVQHGLLRWLLAPVPRALEGGVAAAVDKGVLHRVGGGVSFGHGVLRQWWATAGGDGPSSTTAK